MRFRALLLDLDGTLVDASAPIADGILALAGIHGLSVPDRAWALARIGGSPLDTWRLLGAEDPAALVAEFRSRYMADLPRQTRILPGALEALAALRGHGYRLALASTRATDSAVATLEHAGMLPLLEHVLGGDLVLRHKPAPDVIHLALERLGLEPGEALMIGDTTNDIGAAHAAGLPCWAVLGGTHDEATLRDAGADSILSGIAALPAALGHITERAIP
jgi:phosphoglycolate phosphatase